MDVLYFLQKRTRFIQNFYDGAVASFEERVCRIEAEEEPYVSPYREEGELPFLSDWIEADECRDVLGHACLSLLATSMQLFLRTWDRELNLKCGENHKKKFKNQGWFNGYRACHREALNIHWENSSCDMSLLEGLVLARNRVQHPEFIHTVSAKYSRGDFAKLGKRLLFTGTEDTNLPDEVDRGEFTWLLAPNIKVTREALTQALKEVETFCGWLDVEVRNAFRGAGRGA